MNNSFQGILHGEKPNNSLGAGLGDNEVDQKTNEQQSQIWTGLPPVVKMRRKKGRQRGH